MLDGARGHALLGLKSSATKFVRGCSAKASAGMACAGLCCSAGCPPRRSGAGIRRRRCPAKRVAYGLIGLAQKEAWGSGVLTETWQKSEMRCTMVHVEVGGGDVVAFGDGSLQRPEWSAAGPGKLQKSWRSRCAPWTGPRCGGAAESRRRRGFATAQRAWQLGFGRGGTSGIGCGGGGSMGWFKGEAPKISA